MKTEKAEELLDKFTTWDDAVFCVKEILKTNVDTSTYGTAFTKYWKGVLAELLKK